MKALLLAGGKGTRLKPLTNNLPKPMVPILGEPLLKRTICNLQEFGINEIIISICYQPEEINSYFGDGKDLGIKIRYIQEDIPLGTGGAVKNAQSYLDSTFMVLNSDIVTNINITDLIKHHRTKNGIATIALTSVKDPSQYGVVDIEDGYITAFKEKPRPHEITSNLINAGIYVFEPEIFDLIPDNQIVSIEKDIYPWLILNNMKLAGYFDSYYWIDIGTPEKYMQVHYDIFNNKDVLHLYGSYGNIFNEKDVQIRPTANIIPPVYIGSNVELGPKTIIGPYTVIGNNVKVCSGSRIVNSIVWDNVVIGKTSSIINTIVGSNCRVGNTTEICNSVFVKDIKEPVAI